MTVDELISALDAKHPMWEMWRTATREEWVSRDSYKGKIHVARSIVDCMQLLLDYKPLPVVPRQPTLLTLDRFTARKSGSWWSLFYDGVNKLHHFRTKKDALRHAEMHCRMSSENCAEWADKYGELVARGKEGIDYLWED